MSDAHTPAPPIAAHEACRLKCNRVPSGARYFLQGVKLLWHPRLRAYALIPLVLNFLLFVLLTTLLFRYFDALTGWDLHLPQLLQFLEKTLKWVAWLLIVVVVLIGYAYTFNIITNVLAAPFYGLLSQRTEQLISGQIGPEESLWRLIPRTILRELQKLVYFLTRSVFIMLIMLLMGLTVFLNFLAPLLGILWSAWCMALQYTDYGADNHQARFVTLRKQLRKRRYSSLGFGGSVMLCSMVPLLNIVAMPAAVIGGTLFWVNELQQLQDLQD